MCTTECEVHGRALTDADIEALAKALKTEFYTNLGKGVWSLVWKVIITALVGVPFFAWLVLAAGPRTGWR